MPKEESLNIPSRRDLCDDEPTATYITPGYLRSRCESVRFRQNHIDLLGPQTYRAEILDLMRLGHERNVELMAAHGRDEFKVIAFEEFELHLLVISHKLPNQARDESGCKGGKKSDANDPAAAASNRSNIADREINLRKSTSRSLNKALAGLGKSDARSGAEKKTRAEGIFQITDLSADR
nr:hypothetical protein [Roseicella sp. DB1501]